MPSNGRELFVNLDPVETWIKADNIAKSINPNIDLTAVRNVFDDVMCLFDGSFPGYCPIKTPYHDRKHTLDVFICAVRLLHGVHLSYTKLNDQEIALIMIAALLHDIGFAQKLEEAVGSGAQHTQLHVIRGIAFMKQNLKNWGVPRNFGAPLTQIIHCTDFRLHLSDYIFSSPRIRLLGQIVGSADLVGQMADRAYLEKLLFLFLEFKEANYGDCEDSNDLLKKSRGFYDNIRITLASDLGGIYLSLKCHFNEWIGEDRNFYFESIERNMAYLDKVVSLQESEWFSMLKRNGIVQRFKQFNNDYSSI